jgi:hypothetical protein
VSAAVVSPRQTVITGSRKTLKASITALRCRYDNCYEVKLNSDIPGFLTTYAIRQTAHIVKKSEILKHDLSSFIFVAIFVATPYVALTVIDPNYYQNRKLISIIGAGQYERKENN